ncbi:hypothetical protein QQF64_000682 [Cirrhinus molitorella]|uniref:PPM-type phosphatase domain-containing protein n=1 Tax=Cirrhinus molitorella TaxID=172907 RepID=A0ABR3NXV5_9TELE
MSVALLVRYATLSGSRVCCRAALGLTGIHQEDPRRALHTPSSPRCSNSRFDPDSSGRPTTWDSFGIWDNRIDEPIMLPSSIRYVFDGHGGAEAAEFCHKNMEKHIKDIAEEEDNLELVLTKAFLEVDKALARHLHFSADASLLSAGTTATVALLRDGIELVVASVGDSRAMLCRRGKALKLTVDHTPERKDEKERIRKTGGFITWNSLGQPHVNGRLAMTRSIGDFDLKTSGVIAEPETKRVSLHHVHDSFLALTTDGINFIMNSQEICNIINQCNDPKEAAQRISEQALQYGTEDNSTIIVVPFGAWGKHKSSDVSFSFSRSFVSSGRFA